MGEMFNPPVDQGRAYIRYVCKELINHPTIKSELVVGLACFDYAVLFKMPKDQAAVCYLRLFHSFCVRGWLAKELKNIHMDEYKHFIDNIRFVSLDEQHIGLKIEDMISFLSSSSELAKREQTSHVFRLCCLCLGHVVPKLPSVALDSPGKSTAGVFYRTLSSLYRAIYWVVVLSRKSLPAQSRFHHVSSCWTSSEIKKFNRVLNRGLVWISVTNLRYMLIKSLGFLLVKLQKPLLLRL